MIPITVQYPTWDVPFRQPIFQVFFCLDDAFLSYFHEFTELIWRYNLNPSSYKGKQEHSDSHVECVDIRPPLAYHTGKNW